MKNPFKGHKLKHYMLVYDDLINRKPKKVLDFGTGTSEFVSRLKPAVDSLWAYDVDKENVKNARKKYPYIKYKYVKVGDKLPYKSNFFDAVFMFHVLEHVESEVEAVTEASRILKKGGVLYLASPYNGLFTWADTANLRYRFPTIHRWFMKMTLGEDEYMNRFKNKADQNLFGDCSANRRWHKHYKRDEIDSLVNEHFDFESFERFSLFHPFLLVVDNIWNYFSGQRNSFTKSLIAKDNQIDAGDLSYNFLAILKKK